MRAAAYEVFLHLREHKGYYLITLFLLTLGVAAGSVTASGLPVTMSVAWAPSLGSNIASGGHVFWTALWRETRFFGLIGLCGIGIAGIPATALLIAIRGFIVGFAMGFLLSHHGMGGFLVSMLAVIPQNLVILPSVLTAASTAMRAPIKKKWGRRHWMIWLVCFGVALTGVGIEALLSGLLPNI